MSEKGKKQFVRLLVGEESAALSCSPIRAAHATAPSPLSTPLRLPNPSLDYGVDLARPERGARHHQPGNMALPLEQALQNIFTVERADTAGLEKLGGSTYVHWLCKEIFSSPTDGVDKATVRQLLDVSKRLWNSALIEAKNGGGKLNAAVRTLALTAMSVALQHPELRLFGDDEKRRCASNLCKLAHEFATDLDDIACAERCCSMAQELLDGCSIERVIFHRAHVLCARTRVALHREDADQLRGLLTDVKTLLCDERAAVSTDTLQFVEVASLLVHVARGAVGANASTPSPTRAALLIDVFEAVLRICDAGLALCGDTAMAAQCEVMSAHAAVRSRASTDYFETLSRAACGRGQLPIGKENHARS